MQGLAVCCALMACCRACWQCSEKDPYQMTNLMAGPSPAIGGAALAALRGNLTALRTCVGTIACSSITMPSLTQ